MARSKKSSDSQNKQPELTRLDRDKLELDPENPRLAEYNLLGATDDEIVKTLWNLSDAREIAMSIAHGGFASHEPLLVEKMKRGDKYVVIEGNRRLTAVRVLLDPSLRKKVGATDLPKITSTLRASLQQLPCAVTTKAESWRYLGFKHVNGPATWGSYAKAKYIADIHEKYGVDLREIAQQIGDQNATVERLYHGLAVVKQAEEWGVFNRRNTYRNNFHFSHIYTGLGYDNIRTFLSLTPADRKKKAPVPKSKKKELGELLRWIYGSKEDGQEPKVKSQNPDLRLLDLTLGSPRGIRALRSDLPLENAKEAADGDTRLLIQAMDQSKHHLQKAGFHLALGMSSATGDEQESILEAARDIEKLARALVRNVRAEATE